MAPLWAEACTALWSLAQGPALYPLPHSQGQPDGQSSPRVWPWTAPDRCSHRQKPGHPPAPPAPALIPGALLSCTTTSHDQLLPRPRTGWQSITNVPLLIKHLVLASNWDSAHLCLPTRCEPPRARTVFSASLDPKWPAHERSSAHACKRPPRAAAGGRPGS